MGTTSIIARVNRRMKYLISRASRSRELAETARFLKVDQNVFRDAFVAALKDLAAEYDEYNKSVSVHWMSASLETSALLRALSSSLLPTSILDLGSGFSSYVFRTYAAGKDISVVSVDDDADWLKKTTSYLGSRSVSTEHLLTWEGFLSTGRSDFDLIFHDIGSMQFRATELPRILDMGQAAGSIVVLDDVHKPDYFEVVDRELRGRRLKHKYLKSVTIDKKLRFAAIVSF